VDACVLEAKVEGVEEYVFLEVHVLLQSAVDVGLDGAFAAVDKLLALD
jgi:hypothetical protein